MKKGILLDGESGAGRARRQVFVEVREWDRQVRLDVQGGSGNYRDARVGIAELLRAITVQLDSRDELKVACDHLRKAASEMETAQPK